MSNKKHTVLFASYEAVPFLKTGGLGDVAGALPGYINDADFDVRVILPKVSQIPDEYVRQMEFVENFYVPLGWRNSYCGLFKLVHNKVTYYFVDNEFYFHRSKVYGEFDDGERMAFFAKAICESISHMGSFFPEILHCNDWHAAMAIVFLREHYMDIPGYAGIKTIFTIHNLKFQGKYDPFVIGDILGLHNTPAQGQLTQTDKHGGKCANYLMGACLYADRITTVSPTYSEEIKCEYYGEGLDWIFRDRSDIVSGILNGIDYKEYNPLKDKYIYSNYGITTIKNKLDNKLKLQEDLDLEINPAIPVVSMIGRLTEQKGLDLLTRILPELLERRIQLIILGTGDYLYEEEFKKQADMHDSNMRSLIFFDNALAHKIYAGSDIMLIPSRFEPCGLTQLMAMKYGTLPVVRETGGLKDTVTPYNEFTGEGNGFSFANFNAHELLDAVDNAISVFYEKPKDFAAMRLAAMRKDYSWKKSAEEYRKLYLSLIDG